MIRHIVMWTIRETGTPRGKLEAMAELKSKLLALKEQIREIRNLEVHFNSISAPQDNFEVILESEFASWTDLETYRKHPAHVAVAEYVKNIRQSRAVIDYEC
ncbi:MAG: Dabb family protein [Bacteroidales bacterium]|nr:Dabb family protein [Bacteroidales bacterium]